MTMEVLIGELYFPSAAEGLINIDVMKENEMAGIKYVAMLLICLMAAKPVFGQPCVDPIGIYLADSACAFFIPESAYELTELLNGHYDLLIDGNPGAIPQIQSDLPDMIFDNIEIDLNQNIIFRITEDCICDFVVKIQDIGNIHSSDNQDHI